MVANEKISDHQIIVLILKNNPEAWEKLYDKYSAVIFGLICNITGDKILAEEIFVEAFLHLREKLILFKEKYSLCPTILRHTFNFTKKRLADAGLKPKSFNILEESSLIQLLCAHCDSLTEVASIVNMTEEEIKKQVRLEILNLRNKQNQSRNMN